MKRNTVVFGIILSLLLLVEVQNAGAIALTQSALPVNTLQIQCNLEGSPAVTFQRTLLLEKCSDGTYRPVENHCLPITLGISIYANPTDGVYLSGDFAFRKSSFPNVVSVVDASILGFRIIFSPFIVYLIHSMGVNGPGWLAQENVPVDIYGYYQDDGLNSLYCTHKINLD